MDKAINSSLVRNEATVLENAVALKTTGLAIDYSNKSCGKILILINNTGSAAKKATIVKGNSLQGTEDMEISVTNGTTVGVVIESGKFENVSGDNKGMVIIKGEDATSLKVQVVELP
ncbi:MAG: hypothetical protein HFJ34_05280 [Clostridia bacterium]|nr:hypothetical protein [Clostridia bacterium]